MRGVDIDEAILVSQTVHVLWNKWLYASCVSVNAVLNVRHINLLANHFILYLIE
jgi:hypothetical protein